MSDKKWCLRYKRTAAGRRCAKYGSSNPKRTRKTCVKYRNTKGGRRCAKYSEED